MQQHAVTEKRPPLSLTIEDIRKDFGDYPALDGVSLKIAGGELVALLGPSGKTTLLRIIAGLEFPSGGTLLFGDMDASRKSVQERNVGFVFQHYALFRHMTVFDNIAFGLRVRKRSQRPPRHVIRERVLSLLELVQLSGLENRYPAQLSGGQRQRVALARALAIEPSVLLLDEPFGALDAKVRKDLRSWLRQIHDETGHTTVFVTHDQDEALELADRVVVMNKGRIEQIGTPDEIYDNPASPFVFDFIGESSHIPVTIQNGQVHFHERPLDLGANGLSDGPAELYVRPHDVEIVEGAAQSIPGIVRSFRRHGATRRLEVEVGPSSRGVQHVLEADMLPGPDIQPGKRVNLRPRRYQLYREQIA